MRSLFRSRSWPLLFVGTALVLAGSIGMPITSHSQQGGAGVALSTDAFNSLIGQIRKQQEQIAANQTKIEKQLAAAKEEVRQVKIYSSRAGSAGRR